MYRISRYYGNYRIYEGDEITEIAIIAESSNTFNVQSSIDAMRRLAKKAGTLLVKHLNETVPGAAPYSSCVVRKLDAEIELAKAHISAIKDAHGTVIAEVVHRPCVEPPVLGLLNSPR